MKIATTIEEMYPLVENTAEAVSAYVGTGFKYLDYSFYDSLIKPQKNPLMVDDWKDRVLRAKETADELGFTFVQAHAPVCEIRGKDAETGITATIRSIEACKILGIKNMVIHSGFYSDLKRADGSLAYFKENEPFFRALIPAMEENDVNILFENSAVNFCPDGLFFPCSAKELNDFIEFMNHPLFGAAWDVGHANLDNRDQYKEITELGKNLKAVHIHDNNGKRDQHTAPFIGTCDFDAIVKGLIDSGYEGYFTLEAPSFFADNRNENLNGPLAEVSLEIKREAVALLYKISKHILSTYDIYED